MLLKEKQLLMLMKIKPAFTRMRVAACAPQCDIKTFSVPPGDNASTASCLRILAICVIQAKR